MHRLKAKTQQYAWGKVGMDSAVAQLLQGQGGKVEMDKPYAEYWFGTHVRGPSEIVTKTGEGAASAAAAAAAANEGGGDETVLLKDWLASNPAAAGDLAYDGFKGDLPYLFKVLSINKGLSIQAHPDKELAQRLHAERPEVYKDPNHKPEMALAITDFEAMCNFRAAHEIAAFVDATPGGWSTSCAVLCCVCCSRDARPHWLSFQLPFTPTPHHIAKQSSLP